MNNDATLYAEGLTKRFGSFTAVNHVSFEVGKGRIFGFLGANGAGKSTTIRMLIGILEPTEGYAVVGGYNVAEEPEMVKQSVGYMSQKFSLYEDLTVEENLHLYGGIYGLDNGDLRERLRWAIGISGLTHKENTLTRELSGGWKQRLALSCALLHRPKIVFLDEPTSGVDPISRRRFWRLIQQISEEGVTVFVTTHYLEEAEYCHMLAFIYNGEIIIEGTPSELKRDIITRTVFEIDGAETERVFERLARERFVEDVSIFGMKVHIIPCRDDVDREYLARFLDENSLPYKTIESIEPSLEDVFIELIKTKRSDA